MPSRMSVSVAKMHDRFSRQQIRHDVHRGVFIVGVNKIQEWLADKLFFRIAEHSREIAIHPTEIAIDRCDTKQIKR